MNDVRISGLVTLSHSCVAVHPGGVDYQVVKDRKENSYYDTGLPLSLQLEEERGKDPTASDHSLRHIDYKPLLTSNGLIHISKVIKYHLSQEGTGNFSCQNVSYAYLVVKEWENNEEEEVPLKELEKYLQNIGSVSLKIFNCIRRTNAANLGECGGRKEGENAPNNYLLLSHDCFFQERHVKNVTYQLVKDDKGNLIYDVSLHIIRQFVRISTISGAEEKRNYLDGQKDRPILYQRFAPFITKNGGVVHVEQVTKVRFSLKGNSITYCVKEGEPNMCDEQCRQKHLDLDELDRYFQVLGSISSKELDETRLFNASVLGACTRKIFMFDDILSLNKNG